ncbi:2-oxoglutarate and iron-dependent oxygenase JMJD4 (JmjC domain-containing protein 4) (Jumonji domain-containing protein 4) (Lysyl-hydroxylase JMJD4), partial [Durusdinium trenchii]
ALCSGRKRWRLVNRDEMSLLRPLYLADLNPVFPMDLEDGQARGVKVYETILEADDLIFVPAGWPHQVDNLETSMAISSNFIDSSNLRRSLEEAEMLANVEEDPGLLSRVLRAAVAAGTMQQLANEVLLYEPLRQFKA